MKIKTFLKGGKECLLCLVRQKLIQVTPEEIVRQNYIIKLVKDHKVPLKMIEVEVPLSHFVKGKRGRADIIVYKQIKNTLYPLIVVECKAPNIPITVKTAYQADRYNKVLGADNIVLTNGNDTLIYHYSKKEKSYLQVESLPKYKDLLNDSKYKEITEEETIPYLDPNGNLKKNYKYLLNAGIIGEDSKISIVPLVSNFVNLFYDKNIDVKKIQFSNYVGIEHGIRYISYGNAAGGAWTGDYKFFILQNKKNHNSEIVSFSIMGKMSARNHPKWGNIIGLTMLNIAIDDFEKSHNSLQYSLDRFVKKQGNRYHFWHNGTLTAGKKGRLKNIEVIEFVKKKNPKLVIDNKIYLGSIDGKKQMKWTNPDVLNLMNNFFEYAILRDQLRRLK